MKRRLFSVFLCVIILFCFSVSAFAAVIPSDSYSNDDGDLVVGVFEVCGLKFTNPDVYRFFNEWGSSSQSLCFYSYSGSYSFIIVPVGAHISFSSGSSGGYSFSCDMDCTEYVFDRSCKNLSFFGTYVLKAGSINGYNGVFGSYLKKGNINTVSEIKPTIPSRKVIVSDDRSKDIPDTGLMGALQGLWDFFKHLFVPSECYFKRWFNEIKTALMDKMGFITSIFTEFNNAFNELKNDKSDTSFFIDIPKDYFFKGFSGVKADLLQSAAGLLTFVKGALTMVCVVFTAIACYRRIIVIFEV